MNEQMLNRLECAQELLNDVVKNPEKADANHYPLRANESATATLNEAANYLFGYVDYGEHLEGDHYTTEESVYNCLMIDVLHSKDRVAVALYDSLVMLWRDLMFANDLDPKYHFIHWRMTKEMSADLDKRAKYPEHYAMLSYLGSVGGTFSEAHFLIEARNHFHQPVDDDCRQAFHQPVDDDCRQAFNGCDHE